MGERTYIAIDLKSFYASVECRARGLDPLDTHLVVADLSRTEKTICLAVSPPLKAYGIPGRARLFEVVEQVKRINAERLRQAPGRVFTNGSHSAAALRRDASLELDYIVATPRMSLYMACSTQIYGIYMKYVAPEDIHVYSVDEVFMDATDYLKTTGLSARDFARRVIRDVLDTTGITATAGIGSNLYLAKIAMDIWAKHVPADQDGVRIAELDEQSYRRELWDHRPLTDFWRVGRGYARKLEQHNLLTMGDIARCSLGGPGEYYNEELLYRLFGVNAELLIDHAWGWEPTTIADIKAYRPSTNSLSVGQVLQEPYPFDKARIVLREMADSLAMDLVDKGLVTDQVVLTVCYDRESLDTEAGTAYKGEVTTDHYGRRVPKSVHGSQNLSVPCASSREIDEAFLTVFDRIADPRLLVRRMYVVANHVQRAEAAEAEPAFAQLDLFADDAEEQRQKAEREREKKRQQAMLTIRKKYGKNAILPGTSYQEGATGRERNRQIGGHKA